MKIQLSESMNKKIYTVPAGMAIDKAYGYLKERRVRHLVVLNDEEHVIGVISDRDFQRAIQTKMEKAGSVSVVGEYFVDGQQVRDYMSWGVHTLRLSEGLKEAALKMLELKISSLVIVDDSMKMVGFITSDDLLWALTKLVSDGEDSNILLDLKAQILNSPLGSLVNSISQTGI